MTMLSSVPEWDPLLANFSLVFLKTTMNIFKLYPYSRIAKLPIGDILGILSAVTELQTPFEPRASISR